MQQNATSSNPSPIGQKRKPRLSKTALAIARQIDEYGDFEFLREVVAIIAELAEFRSEKAPMFTSANTINLLNDIHETGFYAATGLMMPIN